MARHYQGACGVGRFPAITSRQFGKGRVTYVGTLPNPALGKTLAAWVMAKAGVEPIVPSAPALVRVTTAWATAPGAEGKRLWFSTNWSFEPATVTLPIGGTDLFAGQVVAAGAAFALGAWDVKIVVES